jgi:hypothetical protein
MPQPITLEMAAEVVAAFVSKNPLPRGELPYAPTTADLDVEWPLQTAAVELALGRRPAYGRQKRRPPAAQSRSASLPMGHQPQPMFRRPLACGAASGVGGSAPA